MKNLNEQRIQFSTTGKILRESRNDEIPQWKDIILSETSSEAKNELLREMAIGLIERGYYAKPGNYNPQRPQSYRNVLQAIMIKFSRVAYRESNDPRRFHHFYWEFMNTHKFWVWKGMFR